MVMDEAGRPGLGAEFYKAHGLGNDYLVFEGGAAWAATPEAVQAVCNRWRGVGSDGIVCRVGDGACGHDLRMFNPDGSEFERSGNGLRIFAAYLASRGGVREGEPFRVEVGGDVVQLEVLGRGGPAEWQVQVDMGRAEVGPEAVDADAAQLTADGGIRHSRRGELDVTLVSLGNPHCVYFTPLPGIEILREVGPVLTAHRAFPRGINVQVVRVLGPGRLHVGVWERGVGETSASGTSACAAAVAAVRRGLVEPGTISVEMTGGVLEVEVTESLDVRLRGPVEEVCSGALTDGFCRELARKAAE